MKQSKVKQEERMGRLIRIHIMGSSREPIQIVADDLVTAGDLLILVAQQLGLKTSSLSYFALVNSIREPTVKFSITDIIPPRICDLCLLKWVFDQDDLFRLIRRDEIALNLIYTEDVYNIDRGSLSIRKETMELLDEYSDPAFEAKLQYVQCCSSQCSNYFAFDFDPCYLLESFVPARNLCNGTKIKLRLSPSGLELFASPTINSLAPRGQRIDEEVESSPPLFLQPVSSPHNQSWARSNGQQQSSVTITTGSDNTSSTCLQTNSTSSHLSSNSTHSNGIPSHSNNIREHLNEHTNGISLQATSLSLTSSRQILPAELEDPIHYFVPWRKVRSWTYDQTTMGIYFEILNVVDLHFYNLAVRTFQWPLLLVLTADLIHSLQKRIHSPVSPKFTDIIQGFTKSLAKSPKYINEEFTDLAEIM